MKTPTFNPKAFDVERWERRWEAVKAEIDHMLATMKQQDKTTRQATLRSVLTALQAFGGDQIHFFLQGFGPQATVFLEPSTLYPPDYALRATLDQIVHDMSVIVRAWEQRQPNLASKLMRQTLDKADLLANGALAPAIQHGLLEPATVVTYFQKDTNVRIIPYAPVSFIGLPITCQTVPLDLLAIPHEVGHYVYRYGRVRSGEHQGSRFDAALTQRYGGQSPWRQAWMEEIFADVYGGLIGGPVMALGFEDLLSDTPRDEFTYDDGEHPIAALRLNIYQTVFEVMGIEESVTTALADRATAWRKEHGNPTTFMTVDGSEVDLAQAQAEMEEIVRSLLTNELAGVRAKQPWSGNLGGAVGGNLDTEEVLATLHTQFETMVHNLSTSLANEVTELQLSEPGDDGQWMRLQAIQEEGKDKTVERKVGETDLWIDLVKDAVKQHQNVTLPPRVWMALLDGSGWAIEETGGNAH
ncbi:MAG: hypothetical protein R3E79_55515 [Caldilineaceae bacterium]